MAVLTRFYLRVAIAVTALLAATGAACRFGGERHAAVGRDLASYVPAGTQVLAGVDLQQLRTSPLYPELPGAARAMLESVGDASNLLLAYDAQHLLAMARGDFRQPPAGATMVNGNLALAGSPDAVRAALAQQRSGRGGAPELVARADALAAGGAAPAIWVAARGSATLPAVGDIANLNRLLHMTDYTTVAVRLNSRVDLDAAAVCRDAATARALEENARGLLSLAAAMMRQGEASSIVRASRVVREGNTVRVTASATADAAAALLRQFSGSR